MERAVILQPSTLENVEQQQFARAKMLVPQQDRLQITVVLWTCIRLGTRDTEGQTQVQVPNDLQMLYKNAEDPPLVRGALGSHATAANKPN